MSRVEQRQPRRRRDPEGTRLAILEAAKTMLSQDGAEGLSVSGVAKLAGVNRGTAYQHFELKEDLVRATLDWVSSQLLDAVFPEDIDPGEVAGASEVDIGQLVSRMAQFSVRLADFAIDNPDIGRIWLYDLLSRDNPSEDVFYKRFMRSVQDMVQGGAGEEGIDIEVLTVLMLSGFFLWPVWVSSHAQSKRARKSMSRRFAGEVLRLSMHGVLRADTHALLQSYLEQNPVR
ncbi:TetR/AcrR family transcriptional regulator [Mangrovimicrobium sediminis]|uniref:TetR/AcrR family transcriptional regulator n=1 Tax=Mangrovimicrobium sediminis TaxID=2562682 RepID=A0A4Z0LVV0_9GAMM|nr:TetR/AcrR family transcriptional regulator [Haliea sp. SAOS-164]TGD71380.1 TetR/AcrR family transcriptional regulator [Haliea sp. SAOS-164]